MKGLIAIRIRFNTQTLFFTCNRSRVTSTMWHLKRAINTKDLDGLTRQRFELVYRIE
jgi:hypothetical protein